MMNDRRFVEAIGECAHMRNGYVCMRPSESADHLQPVADIPSAQNAALRRSLYIGRKMAITIVFQSSSLCAVYNRINCRSLIKLLCVVTINFCYSLYWKLTFQVFVKTKLN